jgi:hypothetical protein
MSQMGHKRTFDQVGSHVRFTPESGQTADLTACPLSAKSRREQSQQGSSLFDHLVGDGEQRWSSAEAANIEGWSFCWFENIGGDQNDGVFAIIPVPMNGRPRFSSNVARLERLRRTVITNDSVGSL